MKKSSGFTLIELVVVMVILAILAVVAIPQFVDLRADAQQAAREGVAGALSSASAINFGARSVNATKGVAITDCANVASAMQGGALPAGYSITGAAVAAGVVKADCVLTGPGGGTTNFTAIGIL